MRAWGARVISLAAALAVCFGVDFFFASLHQDYVSRMAFLTGLYVILAVSLNIINGICGQFSIGHAAFYQIGAYVTGFISVTWFSRSGLAVLPWLILLLPVGAIAAGIVGFIVGLPSLKLRGDYLAIVTLGAGEIIRIITINIKEIGGSYGMSGIVVAHPLWLVWLVAVACIAVSRNLLKSAHGLSFLAIREDEIAAAAMGVNVTRTKVVAFIMGSMFAGVAGVLFAHNEAFITTESFKMEVSFIILTMVVLGGTGSITGAAMAAIALFLIPEYMRGIRDVHGNPVMVSGSAFIAVLIATGLVVAAFKRIQSSFHGGLWARVGLYLAAVGAGAVVELVFSFGFGKIPVLAAMHFEVSKLRMVILAGTLIVVMQLRPQGILGHHEFSWKWLGGVLRTAWGLLLRLLGRRREAAA